jgi:mono/diheme cytochrome c family protein
VFKRAVNGLELLALIAAVVFVVLLAYRPETPRAAPAASNRNAVGSAVYASNCSSCHGPRGEGGSGPKLAGGAVVVRFPNEQDEIAIVTNGKGSMPAWRNRLTAAQIQAVVEYTRTHL